MKKIIALFLLFIILISIQRPLLAQLRILQNFKDTASLSFYLDSLNGVNSFSGIAAIAKEDKLIYWHAKGFANIETETPIFLNTLFDMGSMTKMFTGVAIMQLVEQNKIQLKDPIDLYLPEYPNKKWTHMATIENLLTHTSGIGEFIPHGHSFTNLYNLQEILDTIAIEVPTHLPDQKMEYSNAGFYVLGRIIEVVSGLKYFDFIQKNIFDKASMKNTFFEVPKGDRWKAIGYMLSEKAGIYKSNEGVLNKVGGPAGGAYTDVPDMLAFQRALKTNKLISEKTFGLMTRLMIQGQRGMGYGLGIGVGTLPNGVRWIGHNGGGPGIAANFAWFIEKGYSVIVFMNQDAETNMSVLLRTQFFVSEMH